MQFNEDQEKKSQRKDFPAWSARESTMLSSDLLRIPTVRTSSKFLVSYSWETHELMNEEEHYLGIIIFVRCALEACDYGSVSLITDTKIQKSSQDNEQPIIMEATYWLTFLPPVLIRRGVRKGSKIMWLVSMLTGDCRFPTEQRFQAEFTNPQKEGTRSKVKL